MDPTLSAILGYSPFSPPGGSGLGRLPTPMPMLRPQSPVAMDTLPPEAYGGQMGAGESGYQAPPPIWQPEMPTLNPAEAASPVTPNPTQPTVADQPPQPMLNPAIAPPQEAYRSEPSMVGWQGPTQTPAGPYQEAYRGEPMSLGATMEPSGSGVPMPRPRPAGAPTGAAPAAQGGDALLKSLQGVKAPAAPTPQKVGTPNLPAVRPIQGGGFAELLASLSAGPQAAAGGMKLPPTLLAALGGR